MTKPSITELIDTFWKENGIPVERIRAGTISIEEIQQIAPLIKRCGGKEFRKWLVEKGWLHDHLFDEMREVTKKLKQENDRLRREMEGMRG